MDLQENFGSSRVVGDSWEFLTEWEGAEDSPTWEPPGNFLHRHSSEFVKYCHDHRVKFDLVQHLATQEPREVNQVVYKFGCWPYVREDYAVRREVFEEILVGLGVPDPPVDAFATEANHLCPVWWGPGGEHEDAFAQSWKGQFLWMKPSIPCWIKLYIGSRRTGRVQCWCCPIGHIACSGDVCELW